MQFPPTSSVSYHHCGSFGREAEMLFRNSHQKRERGVSATESRNSFFSERAINNRCESKYEANHEMPLTFKGKGQTLTNKLSVLSV